MESVHKTRNSKERTMAVGKHFGWILVAGIAVLGTAMYGTVAPATVTSPRASSPAASWRRS